MFGRITGVDSTAITVREHGKAPIKIPRAELLQISQGDALLFTAFSSWENVSTAHLDPGEAFVLKLHSGKLISGTPVSVTPDSITLKHGIATTEYKKSDVLTVDYLRMKPPSDGFDYTAKEAPEMLFLYPEFYYRLVQLEGRIPVRLYDVSEPGPPTTPRCPFN